MSEIMAEAKSSNSPGKKPVRRKRGRPKGSKTKPAPKEIVVEEKPRCLKCSSTELEYIGRTKSAKIRGVHNGQSFDEVIWKMKKCKNCRQVVSIKTRKFKGNVVNS